MDSKMIVTFSVVPDFQLEFLVLPTSFEAGCFLWEFYGLLQSNLTIMYVYSCLSCAVRYFFSDDAIRVHLLIGNQMHSSPNIMRFRFRKTLNININSNYIV